MEFLLLQVDPLPTPEWTKLSIGVPLRQRQDKEWRRLSLGLVHHLAGAAPVGLLLTQLEPERNWYADAILAAGGQVQSGPEPLNAALVRVAGWLPPGPGRDPLLAELWADETAEMGLMFLTLLPAEEPAAAFLTRALESGARPPLGQGLLHPEGDGAILELHLPARLEPLRQVTDYCRRQGIEIKSLDGQEWPR